MRQKPRYIYSQLYHNQDLPESPIPSQREESDDSHEADLYPATYQPHHHQLPRHLNLQQTVTRLMSQLKEWLIDLCLTEHSAAEAKEQLEPIIEELV